MEYITLQSSYALLNELGSGGMGKVHLAQNINNGRLVAIKTPKDKSSIGISTIQHEIEILTRLQEKGQGHLIEHGSTADGTPCIVLEYLEGVTLEKYLNSIAYLSKHEALNICAQVAMTLSQLHRQDVVHCDIKPSNIIVSVSGNKLTCHIIDFGIASTSRDVLAESGSPLYMSPEQMFNLSVTRRSDLYQLGLVLFECLFGRLPFKPLLSDALIYRLSGSSIPDWCQHQGADFLILKLLLKVLLNRSPEGRCISMALAARVLLCGTLIYKANNWYQTMRTNMVEFLAHAWQHGNEFIGSEAA